MTMPRHEALAAQDSAQRLEFELRSLREEAESLASFLEHGSRQRQELIDEVLSPFGAESGPGGTTSGL